MLDSHNCARYPALSPVTPESGILNMSIHLLTFAFSIYAMQEKDRGNFQQGEATFANG